MNKKLDFLMRNKSYDKEIYSRVMPDFRMNNSLQKLIKFPFVLNYIIGSVDRHKELENAFNNALIHLQQPSLVSKLHFIFKTAYIFTVLKLSHDFSKFLNKNPGGRSTDIQAN